MTSPNASLGSAALDLDARVRKSAPLVHHITNYVVVGLTANVTLALGAQPVMAHAPQEMEEMEGFASRSAASGVARPGSWPQRTWPVAP